MASGRTPSTRKPRSGSSVGMFRVLLAGSADGWWLDVARSLHSAGLGGFDVSVRAIAELPVMQDVQRQARGADVVVLAPDAECPAADLLRAAALVRECDVPAVVVLPQALAGVAPRLAGGCVHVVPQQSDAKLAAGLIAGLAARQPTVRRIHDEMATAWRAQEQAGTLISRVDEELRLAARVQQQLLPRSLPEDCGVRIGVVFRPASYVSGDIYRIERLSDGRIAFLLADVMGHGVKAAMHSILVAQSLPMQDRLGDQFRVLDPAAALHRLNDELVRQRQDDANFATAVYGLIDPASGRVRLASAGHPPAAVFGPKGLRSLDASGPMLGVFNDAEFIESDFNLARDESLLLYSDGVEQALTPAIKPPPKGAAMMCEAVRRVAASAEPHGDDLDSAAAAVRALFDSQSGSLHQGDDVSVLLLRRR